MISPRAAPFQIAFVKALPRNPPVSPTTTRTMEQSPQKDPFAERRQLGFLDGVAATQLRHVPARLIVHNPREAA